MTLAPARMYPVAADVARDGHCFVAGVLDAAQIPGICCAIEACRATPGPTFRVLSTPGQPHLESELFRATDQPEIRAIAAEGMGPRLACAAFGTERTILMEDSWFLSEPGAGTRSPWHWDHPYPPIARGF